MFLFIAGDIQRYRLFMLPAILEKLAFAVPALVLYAQGRAAALVAGAGIIDLMLAVFFVLAFRASRRVSEIRPLSWSHAGTKVPLPFREAPCEADNPKKSSP